MKKITHASWLFENLTVLWYTNKYLWSIFKFLHHCLWLTQNRFLEISSDFSVNTSYTLAPTSCIPALLDEALLLPHTLSTYSFPQWITMALQVMPSTDKLDDSSILHGMPLRLLIPFTDAGMFFGQLCIAKTYASCRQKLCVFATGNLQQEALLVDSKTWSKAWLLVIRGSGFFFFFL